MPPKLSAIRRLLSASSRKSIGLNYCPACSFWRISNLHTNAPQSTAPRPASRSRRSSTVASTTAINAARELPPNVRELHDALSELRSKAANYVNLSRLQLALRGLETRDAVVRVAVLGLNGQTAAARLVRLLLADPLAPEQPWERQMDTVGENAGRGLLIRYGEGAGTKPQSPLLAHLEIPSSTLRSNNLEILITTLNVTNLPVNNVGSASQVKEAFLVPALETTAASASGRYSTITYPVHKALVFGEGIESAMAYARYTAGQNLTDASHLVKLAIGMDMQPTAAGETKVPTVNLPAAEAAINAFRQSVENAIAYEHGWLGSGMPTLADWLIQGSQPTDDGTIKPAVHALIQSILADAADNINQEDLRRSQDLAASAIPQPTRQALTHALTLWAERAHTELRDQVDRAFTSRRWRRLAWWKLFWRVDDVAMIAGEVLERSWLVAAEKELIWLAGRIQQAGLVDSTPDDDDAPRVDVAPPRSAGEQHALGASPPAPIVRDLIPPAVLAATSTDADADADADTDPAARLPPPRPWPTHIAHSRHRLAGTLPDLQALAQRLVLTALSTTTVTSALAALMYVSVSTTSVYEAGAIVAAAAVWSMWRLQGRWEESRRGWEGEVREEGRRILRVVEGAVGGVVREGGRGGVGVEGVEERRVAREAVGRGREVLGRVR